MCFGITRGFKERPNEARDDLPHWPTRQIAHAAQLSNLAFHMCVAPLEMPPLFLNEVIKANDAITNDGDNALSRGDGEFAKGTFPASPAFLPAREPDEYGVRYLFMHRFEQDDMGAVLHPSCSDFEPMGINYRDQLSLMGNGNSSLFLEQDPESSVEPIPDNLSIDVRDPCNAAERGSALNESRGNTRPCSFYFSSSAPRTNGPGTCAPSADAPACPMNMNCCGAA